MAAPRSAEDRYKLTVTVNDTQVAVLNVIGVGRGPGDRRPAQGAEGRAAQPRPLRRWRAAAGLATPSRWPALPAISSPTRIRRTGVATINRRVYLPAAPELDGKALPVGFRRRRERQPTSKTWPARSALGGRARVALTAWRNIPDTTPEWERDFLVVEEHLPAGTTLIEGSVQTSRHLVSPGRRRLDVLTSHPRRTPASITYDVHGYLPGQYRALPTSIRSAYEPGRFHLGPRERPPSAGARRAEHRSLQADTRRALMPSARATSTPADSPRPARPLEPLFAGYTLRDDIGKDAARMLLLINIRQQDAAQDRPVFRGRQGEGPELVLTFDQLLAIGKAYRDINEYERAMIVWRGADRGQLPGRRPRRRALAPARQDTRRDRLPDRSLAQLPQYGLDRERLFRPLAGRGADGRAGVYQSRPAPRTGDGRHHPVGAAASVDPHDPGLPVAITQEPGGRRGESRALGGVHRSRRLQVRRQAGRRGSRSSIPKSTYQDSFQYSVALANFHLGQYDRAIEVAQTIARATYKDAAGADQPSPNKWQALYILGQIHDARRQPGKALEYYRQVADRFSDAAGAIQSYTRKDLKVPEVSVIRPENRPVVAGNRRREASA